MQEPGFTHHVFVNHSAKDGAVVRPLVERLNAKAEVRRKKAELEFQPSEFSLQPLLGDPPNHERRFMSELQPSAFSVQPFLDAPIKGSLAQFSYINRLALLWNGSRHTPGPGSSG